MWRDVLWGMLQIVGIVRSQSAEETSLRTSWKSLLDALFEELLLRSDVIVRRGLTKEYRHKKQSIDAVRGRIMLAEYAKRNHVHKERTYCRYLTYTPDVHLNQILKKPSKSSAYQRGYHGWRGNPGDSCSILTTSIRARLICESSSILFSTDSPNTTGERSRLHD